MIFLSILVFPYKVFGEREGKWDGISGGSKFVIIFGKADISVRVLVSASSISRVTWLHVVFIHPTY